MKVVFVYTDYNPLGYNRNKFNIGVAALSASLKSAGHQTELIHISEKIGRERFIRRVRESDPSLVAFSCISNMWPQIRQLTRWIAELDIPTIHGGLHPTIMPDEVIGSDGVRILCRGEGEGAIVDLCGNMREGISVDNINNLWVKKKNGEIIRNPIRPLIENLDELPFLDYDIFNYPRLEDAKIVKRLVIMASRGCPYQCAYCCNHLLKTLYPNNEKYTRFKSVDRLMEEIKRGLQKYPFLKIVRFADDTLSLNKEWFSEFVDKYSREINLPYVCNDRANQIDFKTAEGLKRSRCVHVGLGIESGDEYIRNKIMKRNLSDEQIITAYAVLKSFGIETTAFNILGAPFETMDTLLKTVKLNAMAKPDNFTNAYFYPYNGTALFDICKKEGYGIKEGILSFFERPILRLHTVSGQQIMFVYKYFYLLTGLYAKYMGSSGGIVQKLISRTDGLLCSPSFPCRFFNKIYDVFDYFRRAVIFYTGKFPPVFRMLRFIRHKIIKRRPGHSEGLIKKFGNHRAVEEQLLMYVRNHAHLRYFLRAIRTIFRSAVIYPRKRRLIRQYLKTCQIRKLQIGCGENILKGWLNADFDPAEREAVFLDAKKRLPFDDRAFDYIFNEHMIEHLEYQDGVKLLRECYRIMKPGGKIRISTPDLRFLIELYNEDKTELQKRFIERKTDTLMRGAGICSDTFVINNFFRDWGHKFIYDYNTLRDVLERCGFIDITRHEPKESDDINLRGIERHGSLITDAFNKLESMALEGTRPAA